MLPLLLLLPLATGAAADDGQANMTKRCIPAGPPESAGSCLDGSPYCFYERLNASSTKWVFFFEGGGACEGAEACVQRGLTGGGLGSSTNLSDHEWTSMPDLTKLSAVLAQSRATSNGHIYPGKGKNTIGSMLKEINHNVVLQSHITGLLAAASTALQVQKYEVEVGGTMVNLLEHLTNCPDVISAELSEFKIIALDAPVQFSMVKDKRAGVPVDATSMRKRSLSTFVLKYHFTQTRSRLTQENSKRSLFSQGRWPSSTMIDSTPCSPARESAAPAQKFSRVCAAP
eukprot:COSAG06_NODE_1238_length_10133_cov_3382.190452_16_plen_286_part_00